MDHADDIEAVIIASIQVTKPDFESLTPATKGIEAIGIPADRIDSLVVQTIFRRYSEKLSSCMTQGLDRLPSDPLTLLDRWYG